MNEKERELHNFSWDTYNPRGQVIVTTLHGMPVTAVAWLLCDGRGSHEPREVGSVLAYGDPDADMPIVSWEIQPTEGKRSGTRILVNGKRIPKTTESAYFSDRAMPEKSSETRLTH